MLQSQTETEEDVKNTATVVTGIFAEVIHF
jgi:hypothetical protein